MLKIKDDEIIYLAVDEGFRFFKLEDGLTQFANKPQFTPDFIGMTSSFKCSEQSDTQQLRCLIAYELDHSNHWNNSVWNYYKCRFVDSQGETVVAKFNNISLDYSGIREYHGGNNVQKLKFELYDSSDYEDFKIDISHNGLLDFVRKFVFAIQIANTIEEFKKGMKVYDLIYRFFKRVMPDRLYETKYKFYQGEMGKLSKHIPRVGLNHKERFFAMADNYETHLDAIKEYEKISAQLGKEINPYRWDDE